jgi:hypothetical protein
MSSYGSKPTLIRNIDIQCKEMMFYQDMLIKDTCRGVWVVENRLKIFSHLIRDCAKDFIDNFGPVQYARNYMYLSAKHLFQPANQSYNRPGWHSDGFGSDDINYIWSNKFPTVFNNSTFNLSNDDKLSMDEMAEQALPENDFTYPDNSLVRLDQYNIHRVATNTPAGFRTFVKVTFSKSRFNLLGNAHNYELDYTWQMKPRGIDRNVPAAN